MIMKCITLYYISPNGIIIIIIIIIIIVGLRAQIIYWALGLVREHGWSEEERMIMNDSGSVFNE